MQLEYPDKEEVKDYRIPNEKRFQEWRNYLGPICHYLAVRVIKVAKRTHGAHDATTKNNVSIFNSSFVCESSLRVVVCWWSTCQCSLRCVRGAEGQVRVRHGPR